MKNFFKKFITTFAIGLSFSVNATPISGQGTWETSLQGRDLDGNLSTFEAYYDASTNITWIANAQILGSRYASLSRDFSFHGIIGWRLPRMEIPAACATPIKSEENNCVFDFLTSSKAKTIPSEFSYLYYTILGNDSEKPFNSGPFTGSQEIFWTIGYSFDFGYGVAFDFRSGEPKIWHGGRDTAWSWLVIDGDVTPAVPEPSAWLMALGGLIIISRIFIKKSY